jgi:hypothetical protein
VVACLARSVDYPSLSTAMHAAGALRDAMVGKQFAGRDNQTSAAKSSTRVLTPLILCELDSYNPASNERWKSLLDTLP